MMQLSGNCSLVIQIHWQTDQKVCTLLVRFQPTDWMCAIKADYIDPYPVIDKSMKDYKTVQECACLGYAENATSEVNQQYFITNV